MDQETKAGLIEDTSIEVMYIVCQRDYDFSSRLEAIREMCAELGWTLGSA
jgi:hypothetical protein